MGKSASDALAAKKKTSPLVRIYLQIKNIHDQMDRRKADIV